MFETIIALFIKRYVARYININADQLSAQLLYKQQIIIENLILNKTTLNEDIQTKFKLPIEIQSIHIGKIQVSFILSSLFFRSSSAAFIVKIQGVHAVINSTIIDEDHSSSENFNENNLIKKRNQLNLAEQQLEKEFECFGEVKTSRWNVQRLLMSFFEKLQVEITDVHISYQCSALYTMGFTCENILISNESLDESMSRQVFRIINPGFYIDINHSSTHSYILSPTNSMEIYLIHNHFLASQKEYRYEFECSFNDLNMKCNIEQIRILIDTIRSIQYSSLHRMLTSDPSRPQSKISKQSVKAWWYYATLTVLRTQVDSRNFWFNRSLLIYRLHRMNIYQQLYRAYLDNKYSKTLNFSSKDELLMNEIELEFDIKYLLIIRRSIFQKRITEQLNQRKETQRWYSNYAKWITTKVIDLWGRIPEDMNENDKKLEEQVNTFIAESLEDEDLLENCQNSLIFRFKFLLKSVQIDLLSTSNNILFNFYLKNLSLTTEFRLRHRSILASACLEDFYMCDQEQLETFSKIICSKEKSNQIPMFEFSFEKKPKTKISKHIVYSISMRSCGLCIVCCPGTLERLHHFYTSAFGPSTESLSASFYNWKKIKNYATRNVISILERIIPASGNNRKKMSASQRNREKKKFYIHVDIGAPKIIIPLSSDSALIADLGCVILTNHASDEQQIQENDNEDEFLTPNSSPLADDNPLEEETTYYSTNTIPTDMEYSSFSLSVRDMQVGYSVDLSQIVEKFSIHFTVQHPIDHLWPLMNISSTIPKLTLHMNSQIIQTLYNSVNSWTAFIKNINIKQTYRPSVWPTLNFRLNEISLQLNDETRTLCDIRLQNIDLSLIKNHSSNNVIFTLQTLTIIDYMLQQDGLNYEYLLKIDQQSNTYDNFLRINADFSTTPEIRESNLTIDINATKLDLIFNPKTICTLINLFSWNQTIVKPTVNQINFKFNSTFRELNVYFINITPAVVSNEIHAQNVALNILINTYSTFEVSMSTIQIIDHLINPQQPIIILMIDREVSQNTALHLLLTNTPNNEHDLSINIASIFYLHSFHIINSFQQMFDYITQHCHLINNQTPNKKNQIIWLFNHLTHSTLNINLQTLKVTFSIDITLQFDNIHLKHNFNQLSYYEININRIDLTDINLLENISIILNLQMSDTSTEIDLKLISPLRIFLSQNRIKSLQQIFNTSFSHNNTSQSLSKFIFHLQSSQMFVIFQIDRTDKLITISEAILNQCQISSTPDNQRIAIKIDSLIMKDRLINSDESIMILSFIELIDNQHKQFHMKLNKIDIKFIESTWTIISELIDIIGSRNSITIQEKKDYLIEASIDIDAISCLFQDNLTLLMNIDLRHVICQMQSSLNQSVVSSTINGQLGFISIRDLFIVNQLYSERLCTNGTNAITFIFTTEEDLSVRSQFYIRMTSIQYIHTQSFLLKMIDYFNRYRSFIIKPTISNLNRQLNTIELNTEIENMIFVLPEHEIQKSVLIFQLGYINLKKSRINFINIEMKDIDFYSSSYCSINERSATSIHFSNFGFNRTTSMIRQQFYLSIDIEHTSLINNIKMKLSSIDVLFDINHYHLIENIFLYNLNNLFNSLKTGNHTEFSCIIEIDHVGMEFFMLDIDLLSFEHRRSIGYAALTNLYLSFDQALHLLCSTIKFIDTRNEKQENMIIPLSMPVNSTQLEIHLLQNQCIITINSIRVFFIIDWLLAFNEFLNLFCEEKSIVNSKVSIPFTDIKFQLNRFELVLVSTTKNPYANALIYSSTMILQYKKDIQPFECFITDFTFLTCQIGNIDQTAISIIEPTDCSVNIHRSDELLNEKICEINIPILNIRLSYSDIKMIYSLIHSISKQISQAKTRKPLLTFMSSVITSPIRNLQSTFNGFLNIKFLKLICDEIYICLIDDCFSVNIPLLNINLKPFILQTIENNSLHRTDQSEFELIISYYNRFQSGFEPLIERCPLQMTLSRSLSSTLLFISSKEILNLNFTKAMYRLISTIKTNWLNDSQDSNKKKHFRRVKPLDPYCFKNLLGTRIKFRTWMTDEQHFSSSENFVDDNQTISFCFPTRHSTTESSSRLTRRRSNSIVTSLFQSDRRLLISIDGWDTLQPISIDRVGTFFRLAIPSNNQQYSKPILVIIDIAMTDSSIRSITIKSSIEIRNQLLTSIDIYLKSKSNLTYEFSLESNEIRSLPIQLCSMIKYLQIRPTNFALDYCDEPINWYEIENENQSFLRSCSIDGKESVYYVCLKSKQTSLLNYQNQSLSVYQLSIISPLIICNLLPCILNFEILSYPQKFELNPYKYHREHGLNILQNLDLVFSTKLYRMNKSLHLPGINELYRTKHTHQRVIFYDNNQKELMVDVNIVCVVKHRLKILISVPYILMNKSGLPLIFKDHNSKDEAAGQNSDNESTLNREPLLFSFENSNRNNTCLMRVGTGLHRHQDGRPQWSERFSIEHGSTHRQLQVRSPRNLSDWNYSIGIDVRPGNGHLKKINFIFLSARYIICNQCSYDLLIAQQAIKDNNLHISKHATIAYHWPRTDFEQLLCVRVLDEHQYELVNWSGGFQIDCVNVFHINMRYVNGECLILRVQIIERNGTYFVVFMDSNQMPSPFRISNRSKIPIEFYQTEISEEFIYLKTIIQPDQSIDYAWDEPTLKPMMTCSILDGTKANYDLLKLGLADDLNYPNYIYLVFQDTFENQQLVIEYINNRLIVAQRQENKRSQLWYMTNNGILIHIGSLSVQELNKKKEFFDDIRQTYVLDIEDLTDTILRTTRFGKLTVRRYESKRLSTQTWQLLENGYLSMVNTQMCIQVFGELKENNDVILGPFNKNTNQLPLTTMYIRSHQRYKGSGILSVRVIADGPTNVLEIDHKKPPDQSITPTIRSSLSTVYHLDLHFPTGVGISVIGSIGYESEELIYVLVNNLHIEYDDKDNEQSIETTIDTLIISNQLLTTNKPSFLYASFTDDDPVQPAIRLQINWQKFNNLFSLIHIIHSLCLNINSITIQLDEILLWKLIDFFDIEISSLSSLSISLASIDNNSDLNLNDYEGERILSLLTSTHATRIYFNKLYLSSMDLNLSIYCIHSKRSLSPHLLAIKRSAPFPLVPFENAQIHLKSYEQKHISNTCDFFLLSIMTHYVNACTRQAYKILGTVDFLGNPLGLIHDVTDGLTCLVDQGSVSGLVKNVAHGVADSTSKVTGSLSHGLGKLVSDNDRRQNTTTNHRPGSKFGHVIRHGTAGLAAGFYGGLTSIIKQPYKGGVEDGVPGFVKGVAKGIVGTVSKPVVSILDFTNEMAMAIKEGSRSSNTSLDNRIRLTRCPCNTLGLLQTYSIPDAQAHYLLYKINKGNLTERYISRLTLSTLQINPLDKKGMITNNQRNTDAMITTQRVILYRIEDDDKFEIVNSYDFNTSMTVVPIEDNDGSAYIQIILNSKPTIHRCDTFDQATHFSREVQRAQDIFQEEKLIYTPPEEDENEDFDE